MKVPITKPVFDQNDEKALAQVLRSGWVTQGPMVEEFEKVIAKYTNADYAVATTSATTALFLCLYLLEIGPGDEVIVPSFSFIATANVVVHVGAKPVFADINPKTYNIDPAKIEAKITKKTKAILFVDQVGLPADYSAILAIAKRHNLLLIEDAACALGSSVDNKKVGSFAPLTCFSFHPRKAITTGEGGMIVTNNKIWAQKLKMLRHHGMSISDVARHKAQKIVKESYSLIGFNFRMSDLQGALGVTQMKKLPWILKKRAQKADYYTKNFKDQPLITPPFIPTGYVHNFQSYIIRLKNNPKITRDELMQKLLDKGISTRIGVMSAHLQPVYQEMFPTLTLEESEKATKETLTLPLYPTMTKSQQDYVINTIIELIN